MATLALLKLALSRLLIYHHLQFSEYVPTKPWNRGIKIYVF
jgi:hypothetical protein